jgi:hypothetical protein
VYEEVLYPLSGKDSVGELEEQVVHRLEQRVWAWEEEEQLLQPWGLRIRTTKLEWDRRRGEAYRGG